ncbi:TetR/AcrR family transcriptional regulator C-terminal domain-containing protein [Streptomyces sp. NBC_00237]|uniref:TetR/AcrR family transcriptional regulator C-terminal domain-containing protein n=1 Tax=Streptomyces sp. NBC_00237 TaxID=2975687 RepID=UPI0022528FA0|nr:TetR/AcrR family transcriptional regulator C-terminal domain-containing protein [Streptomyces sp. NBC_00237]MCX5204587.1 TetR/AcrR family transcriptional regulator C-terminal domain-containing protein [Streptomyces sp. NBC_00237]
MARDRETPSARVADAIRRRISSGELAPGDRVPSTRQITREWGVAMATASRALAALAQEGLVRAVPGVGTVVAEPSPVTRGNSAQAHAPGALTRERIVRTAVALADTDGLATLTMRRVATELGTSTMALYRHVPGKADLVHLMSEAAFAELPLRSAGLNGWRPRLTHAVRGLWQMYVRHPWMAQAMAALTRPTAAPHAMRYTEWGLHALSGQGLTPSEMMHVHLTLFGHVQGLAGTLELENRARQDTGMTPEEWMATQEPRAEEVQASGDYPILDSYFERDGFELDLDSLFAFGVERILDGVAVLIARKSRAASGM